MSETVPRSAIRVFLHIENRLLREALVRLFRKRADLLVVGQSEDGQSLSTEVMHANCDVFVISFDSGLVTSKLETKALADAGVKVLLISMDANEVQFLAAVRSGVKGCLLKDASASDVVDAIRSLYGGEAVCPRQFCLTLFRFVAQLPDEMFEQEPATKPDLTLRQQQLVGLVAKGLTNKEIATHLNLSEFTVRNHIHRILKQVDADSRLEAVEAIRAYGYTIQH